MSISSKEASQHFNTVTPGFSKSASGGMGSLTFAGNLWPATGTPQRTKMEIDIKYAFAEARAMLEAGYLHASGACRGDPALDLLMIKWFGPRPANGTDWWQGVKKTLGHLQVKLTQDLKLHYRGSDALIGQPDDYPGAKGKLTANDVRGYAEAGAGDSDGVIGLCKAFFAVERGAISKVALKGRDSIGGCLVHEMSHNYCETDDHNLHGKDCYGETQCRSLATKATWRAWYNADNIEYFCEDVRYGVLAAREAIWSGDTAPVLNLQQVHQELAAQLKPHTPTPVILKGQAPIHTRITGGAISKLTLLHQQAAAVANNPSLPVSTGALGGVSALRARFGT